MPRHVRVSAVLISTHAPRTGSDRARKKRHARTAHFNPRSPHGERQVVCLSDYKNRKFQPTLPARGATHDVAGFLHVSVYFNPRSPHGERRFSPVPASHRHTFQPTLPARGATAFRRFIGSTHFDISTHAPRTGSDRTAGRNQRRAQISTHAPRTGSDPRTRKPTLTSYYFNPRSPHGERQKQTELTLAIRSNFNPRSPHGERPRLKLNPMILPEISTHAPRTGSDGFLKYMLNCCATFQPTLPARGATHGDFRHPPECEISTHAPRTGSDIAFLLSSRNAREFQPTLPARGATQSLYFRRFCKLYFNPRSPHGERLTLPGATMRRLPKFQPTLPARGATGLTKSNVYPQRNFNPRSPHGERLVSPARPLRSWNFNPRSPHGERRGVTGALRSV